MTAIDVRWLMVKIVLGGAWGGLVGLTLSVAGVEPTWSRYLIVVAACVVMTQVIDALVERVRGGRR